jgi:hypothetical protein
MPPKTKQILIYVLVAILALSGITAVAQTFAPDNLKPFKTAKSESSSNLAASVSDVKNLEASTFRFDGYTANTNDNDFFFEGADKKIYVLKKVANDDTLIKIIKQETDKLDQESKDSNTLFQLQFKIIGQFISKPKEESFGMGVKKIDYEFTSIESIELSTPAGSARSSSPSKSNTSSLQSSQSGIVGKTLSYTNAYFPDLKINYSDDWKLENISTDSYQKGLLDRRIKLTKGSVTLELNNRLKGAGTTPDNVCTAPNNAVEFAPGLIRYANSDSEFWYYPKNNCFFFLNSNLDANQYSDYKALYKFDKNPIFYMNATLTGTDKELIKQTDQIISQSSFK